MSNHKTPLTELERSGLEAHGLGRCIGKPSQLADAFRAGVAWALTNTTPAAQPAVPLTNEHIDQIIKTAPQMDTGYAGWVRDQRRTWARAIEAAHGITKGQQ